MNVYKYINSGVSQCLCTYVFICFLFLSLVRFTTLTHFLHVKNVKKTPNFYIIYFKFFFTFLLFYIRQNKFLGHF